MGFRMALAQERHDCPSSELPSLGCIIESASGFYNSVLGQMLTLRPTLKLEGQGITLRLVSTLRPVRSTPAD